MNALMEKMRQAEMLLRAIDGNAANDILEGIDHITELEESVEYKNVVKMRLCIKEMEDKLKKIRELVRYQSSGYAREIGVLIEQQEPILKELAEKVISQKNDPVDVDKWASKLAGDLGKFKD